MFRRSLISHLALAMAGLLAFSSAWGQDDGGANFGSPEAVGNRIAEDRRDREQPLKERLGESGVNLAIDYSAVALGASDVLPETDDDASGGMVRFYGSWEAVNWGKSNSGSLVWKVEHRHAYTDTAVKDFEFGAGGLGLITPPFSDEGGRLTNLYWKQRFNQGNGTVIAGFLDSTDYFDVYALASPWTGFLNFAFSTGTTTTALPGDAALGIAAASMLGKKWFVIGGVTDMESDPTDPLNGFNTASDESNFFKSLEFGWTPSKDQIYVDNVHVSYWHADKSVTQGTAKGQGINFSASKKLNQWLPFVRGGFSEDAGTLTESSISTGFAYYGLGRETNNLGVAVNWADIDGSDDDQVTFEAFYFMKLAGFVEITPDIQFIKNPALNPSESQITIYGLRARVVW
ncbi:MAG: carbohydrate porin [Arenicellales bacterium]